MAEYKVAEMFTSINGEGARAGQLAVFVRFKGCNLNCSYCDTQWANRENAGYTLMSAEEIRDRILAEGVCCVTLTGGEPLLQPQIHELLCLLAEEPSLSVEIETNGSVDLEPFMGYPDRPRMTMDYKLPSSGMESFMYLENLSRLETQDVLKFVCGSMEDLERAADIIEEYRLTERCMVYFSPVFGSIDPKDMVEFMKERKLNGVRLQLQMHKFIWDPDKKGV